MKERTEERNKGLIKSLNDDNLKIIEVIEKNIDLTIGILEQLTPTSEIPKLNKILKEKCINTLVKYDFDQIVKKLIEINIEKDCNEVYDDIMAKIWRNIRKGM